MHVKSKGQCKDKCHKKYSYIFLHNSDCKTFYTDIYINALCLPSYQWFWNLYFTNNNIIAKYIVLSNVISVASDNILHICIQEPLLISQKILVLLHTLSAYNSLLVRYKVYSSDPRECLCTSWRYAEAYENFSIDPAPCQKNPIKKIVILNCQPLLLRENYTEIKAWQLKFPYET